MRMMLTTMKMLRRTGQELEAIPMITHKMRMKGKGREKGREKEKEKEKGRDNAGRGTDVIMREAGQATNMALVTATETTMTMEFILMNAQTAMVFGAGHVVLQFLPNTDPSGMKTKAPRWWSTTRRG